MNVHLAHLPSDCSWKPLRTFLMKFVEDSSTNYITILVLKRSLYNPLNILSTIIQYSLNYIMILVLTPYYTQQFYLPIRQYRFH